MFFLLKHIPGKQLIFCKLKLFTNSGENTFEVPFFSSQTGLGCYACIWRRGMLSYSLRSVSLKHEQNVIYLLINKYH